jgi:hypothetical protein
MGVFSSIRSKKVALAIDNDSFNVRGNKFTTSYPVHFFDKEASLQEVLNSHRER